MELLNNAWVIGIGGGILSGLIVTGITRYFFSKKDNREYSQKVATANQEIIYALRPGISEGHIPASEILDALANSTSRKYRVARVDVYQPKQIAEEMIKEIMDSSFISSDTKKNYCETLAHLISEAPAEKKALASQIEAKGVELDYRRRFVDLTSATLGMTAAITTGVLVVTQEVGPVKDLLFPFNRVNDIFVPTLSAVAVAITGVAFGGYYSSIHKRRQRQKSGVEKDVEVSD